MTSPTAASEKRIIGWIEDMIDEPLPSSTDLVEALKDGIALCKLVNKIRSGSVAYINTNPGVLNHLENISAYLQACWTLGVPTDAIFGTQDLFHRRNISNIIKNLDTLAAVTVSNDSSEAPTVSRENGRGSPADSKQIDDYIAEIEELTEEVEKRGKAIRKLQNTIEDHEGTISDKDKEISSLREKLNKVTSQLQLLEEQKDEAPEKQDDSVLTEQLAQRDLKIALLENELEQHKKKQFDMQVKIQRLEESNTRLQQENSSSSLEGVTFEDDRIANLKGRPSSPRDDRTARRANRYTVDTAERKKQPPADDLKGSDGILGQHRSSPPTPGSSPPRAYMRTSRSEEQKSLNRRSMTEDSGNDPSPTTPRNRRNATPEFPYSAHRFKKRLTEGRETKKFGFSYI